MHSVFLDLTFVTSYNMNNAKDVCAISAAAFIQT